MPIECRILVIDDEPNLRSTLFQIFQRAGHSVTVAASCTEARECLRAGTFHLVFIDLKNSERECQKLIREIRCSHPDLPILMLSAQPVQETSQDPSGSRFFDYLLKPVDPATILAKVEKILYFQ